MISSISRMNNDPKGKAITIIAHGCDCRKLVDVHVVRLIGSLQIQGLGYLPAAEKEPPMSRIMALLTYIIKSLLYCHRR
jgi:hypothetical protein